MNVQEMASAWKAYATAQLDTLAMIVPFQVCIVPVE